jgi:hypothetical protein
MSLFNDYITVLTVRYPLDAVMTKRLFRATNGKIGKTDYDNATKFDVRKHEISDLADLAAVLFGLAHQPQQVAIRGKPIAGHHNVRRRLHGDQAAFCADPDGHHWMMLDFDEVPLPLFLEPDDDPELLIGFLVRLLPPTFHDASYYWQWSCGQGVDGWRTLRAHLYFWNAEKHTDREYENWTKWVNGGAGWKVLDPAPFRTVQPNYTAAPIIGDEVDDPLRGGLRHGIHLGERDTVSIAIPTRDWEQHVRELERQEYAELAEYGLRPPPGELPPIHPGDRYLDYLGRIGDDKDGFHDPMVKAIWHWAKAYPSDLDEDFKSALRSVVRAAKCTKQRDLDHYLSDYRLDASIRGAREKQPALTPPPSRLAALQQATRRYSFTRI